MSEQLEVMVIPFRKEDALIMPKNLVEYVLPYAMPLPSSYTHEALVGSLIYRNEKVPVIDVSLFDGKGQAPDSGTRRIVIVSCISEHLEFSSYALIADSAPRLTATNEDLLKESYDEVTSPFYSHVSMDSLPNVQLSILDLEALETQLFD